MKGAGWQARTENESNSCNAELGKRASYELIIWGGVGGWYLFVFSRLLEDKK